MKQEIFDDFKIIFKTSFDDVNIKCVKFDKLYNICDIYCKIKGVGLQSVFFTYNGNSFSEDDYLKTIEKIANEDSKREKLIIILVNHIPKQVNIVFSYLDKKKEENLDIEEYIKTKYSEFLSENQINRDNAILKYKDNIVDTELTINQFINKYGIDVGD